MWHPPPVIRASRSPEPPLWVVRTPHSHSLGLPRQDSSYLQTGAPVGGPGQTGQGSWTLSHRQRPHPPRLPGRGQSARPAGSPGAGCPYCSPKRGRPQAQELSVGLSAYSVTKPQAISPVHREAHARGALPRWHSPLRGGRARAAATAQVPAVCRSGSGRLLRSGSSHVAGGETLSDTWGEQRRASRFLLPRMPCTHAIGSAPLPSLSWGRVS